MITASQWHWTPKESNLITYHITTLSMSWINFICPNTTSQFLVIAGKNIENIYFNRNFKRSLIEKYSHNFRFSPDLVSEPQF